ncbi:carboxypeptidase M32 [Candidatus Thorarchaeota archaeon]|nr:MAG: carboxypeptidase M32 [Candidatus Thorarchaeota archaeon]
MSAYEKLLVKTKEILLTYSSLSILNWDRETYMPAGGIGLRSEQLGLMSQLAHRMNVNPEIGDLLAEASKGKDSLNDVAQRDLYLMKKQYDEQTKLPEKLVADIAKQRAVSTETWKKAKKKQDWDMFQPELTKIVDLAKERAEYLQEVKEASNIYDAMIDDFEPKMTAGEITRVFDELKKGLIPLTKKYADETADFDNSFMNVKVPLPFQRKLATELAALVGYDTTSEEASGRIDEVEHPFTTGYYDDVRITVHYHEDNVASAIFAILHEAGHALYKLNLNPEWKFQAIGSACSAGIHESESRFVENMIGRSPEFWEFYYSKLNNLTNNAFKGISRERFTQAVNLVRPSKIRIEADEVTYSLHIIIRFEIERDLFSGKIEVSELPQIWNEKYEKYLGIEIENDSEGVMQDTHWASGLYGYFPSYALGNVFDGMWYNRMNEDIPDWYEEVRRGNIRKAIHWHMENIHQKSNRYDPADLIERVAGEKMTAKPFLAYLENKFKKIF